MLERPRVEHVEKELDLVFVDVGHVEFVEAFEQVLDELDVALVGN